MTVLASNDFNFLQTATLDHVEVYPSNTNCRFFSTADCVKCEFLKLVVKQLRSCSHHLPQKKNYINTRQMFRLLLHSYHLNIFKMRQNENLKKKGENWLVYLCLFHYVSCIFFYHYYDLKLSTSPRIYSSGHALSFFSLLLSCTNVSTK